MSEQYADVELLRVVDRDVREAAKLLDRDEARHLVSTYYAVQHVRMESDGRSRSLRKDEKPTIVIDWFGGQAAVVERQLRSVLGHWAKGQPAGEWVLDVHGIGPVLAAGFLSHIDPHRAKTAGAVWRFAGLDPTLKWEKKTKRPYNAELKVLAWKAGDSFVKSSTSDKSRYGRIYRERKEQELERDAAGAFADQAATSLTERNIRDKALRETYESGHLPAGRLDLRARRYAVKLFLAHLWEVMRKEEGLPVVAPYPVAIQGHAHKMEP